MFSHLVKKREQRGNRIDLTKTENITIALTQIQEKTFWILKNLLTQN